MEEAIKFVHEFVNDDDNIEANYTYSTTGHSKGGGIAQVLAHTFGTQGTALDPAPGGAVVDCHDYNGLTTDLDFDLPGIPDYGFTSL